MPRASLTLSLCTWLLCLVSLGASAAAQSMDFNNNRHSSRVLAGVIIGEFSDTQLARLQVTSPAICIGLLCLLLLFLTMRRRRRGIPIIPKYTANPWTGGANNQNQGPYRSYPLNYQQPQGGYQPPPGPPPQQAEDMPPPPYPGKPKPYEGEENSGYGYPNGNPWADGAPSPGGFVAPQSPHSPPAAHVNTNPHVRTSYLICVFVTWFNAARHSRPGSGATDSFYCIDYVPD